MHPHNRRSERRAEESHITLSASVNDVIVKEDDSRELIHEDTDLKLVHDVKQLSITDDTAITSTGTEQLMVVVPEDSDDKGTVSNGVTFDIPVASSTILQSTGHFPVATAGNHGNCTSVFIDIVEWLSPLIIGTLDGKVKNNDNLQL